MFESSLVESCGKLTSKSGRYVWMTATFNAAVVGSMILQPLLYPEALPKTSLAAMLTAPPPPAAPPTPRPAAMARVLKATAPLNAFIAPARVPARVDTSRDEVPPPALGTGVTGMTAMAGNGPSPVGALGLGAPMAAAVKVVVPKVAAPPHISSGVIAGNKISGSSPVYPAIAKAAHVAGAVVLHAIISKTGTIQSLSVITGPEMLRANAVLAVQDWKYRPYLLNGEPTEVDTTITVNFSFGG